MADGIDFDISEMVNKIDTTQKKMNTAVNRALKKSAEPLKNNIVKNTPVSGSFSGIGPLKNDRIGNVSDHARYNVGQSGISGGQNDKHIKVGYDKKVAWRMKFVEFGTIHQKGQHVVERSMDESRDEVIRTQASELGKVFK